MKRNIPTKSLNTPQRIKRSSKTLLLITTLFLLIGGIKAGYFTPQAASFKPIDSALSAQINNDLVLTGTPSTATNTSIVNLGNLIGQKSHNNSSVDTSAMSVLMPLPDGLALPTEHAIIDQNHSNDQNIINQLDSVIPAPARAFGSLNDSVARVPAIHGAVGPQYLLSILNNKLTIQRKTGEKLATIALDNFWANLGQLRSVDNRVFFDADRQRWILTASANAHAKDAALLIAVSQTEDATGNWHIYRIDVDREQQKWADSATTGFNKNWIVLQANNYDLATQQFVESNLLIFDKADLYAGGSGRFTQIKANNIGGSQVPAVTIDNNVEDQYLVQNYRGDQAGAGYLALYRITGSIGAERLVRAGFPGVNTTWLNSAKNGRDIAPQAGTNTRIQNNDARIQNVIYRNGSIWAVQTIFLPISEKQQQSAIQWWQLDINGGVSQSGRIIDEQGQTYYACPSLAVNKHNDLLIGYTSFSAATYAGANYAFRAAGDAPGHMRTGALIKSGQDTFINLDTAGNNRWAGYTASLVDPQDDHSLWTIQPYAAKRSTSGTTTNLSRIGSWWAQINPAAVATITSFTPTAGPAGTTVAITGTGFTNASSVRFNSVASTNFTVVSDTQINAVVPAGATTGPISVTNPDGTMNSTTNFVVGAPPSVNSFQPQTGPVGATVIISGSGFTGASAVNFNNGVASNFTVNSDTQITTSVPVGAMNGPITVITPTGSARSDARFIIAAPIVSGFSPNGGIVGVTVNIFGVNFTGASMVSFGGKAANDFTVLSDTQITAVVPINAKTGPISITTPSGTAASTRDFSVFATATLSGFNPSTGPVGTKVTIFGTSLTDATAASFNGLTATNFKVISDTQINANVPMGATTGPISITTPGGVVTSTAIFTVIPSATFSGFTPSSGVIGASITLFGTNLGDASSVRFNGVSASFTANSSTQITAIVPANASNGPITIATPGGTVTSPTNFTLLSTSIVSGFAPNNGAAGTTIQIFGSGFTSATSVSFNKVAATSFRIVSDTQINTSVPVGAITGPISVTTPGGTAISAGNFTVPPPTITSFSPTTAPAGGTVIVNGSGLASVNAVSFNGTMTTSVTVISDSQINVIVPVNAISGPIVVNSPNGLASSAGFFTVIPSPIINSFAPANGTTGTIVTITGANLSNATSVNFNGIAAGSFSVISDNQISATVPAGAITGPITVTTIAGTITSASIFTVDQPGFNLSFNPAQLNIARTQTGNVTVNVIRTGGFTGRITVTVQDTSALKIKFTTLTLNTSSGDSLNFSFKVKKKAPVGMQQITFTARDRTGRVVTNTFVMNIQ